MRWGHLRSIGCAAGVILVGLTTACTSTSSQDTLAPGSLNVQMAVADPMTTSLGINESRVGFQVTLFADLPYSEQRVAVGEADDFSCDGESLIHDGSLQYTFLGSIPSAQVRGDQTCSYTHDGKTTRFSFATPERPAVQTPVINARVSVGQDLIVLFTNVSSAQTAIGIDGKPVMTLAQPVREAIIPAAVWQEFLSSEALSLSVSQTSQILPPTDFNNLEIEYTSSTIIPLTIGASG
jgi:hypothetical protein